MSRTSNPSSSASLMNASPSRSWEPPDTAGVDAEKPGSLVDGAAQRDGVRRSDPDGKRSGERANRPIAAPDNAIPAEAVDRMFDVGPDVVDGPGLRLRVSDDARHLDRDVGPLGDLGDMLAPRMLGAILDRGHAAVI